MGIFSSGFRPLKKADEPRYKSPKSVQETIDILEVSESGIFKLPHGKYSKSYRFEDINYTTEDEEGKEGVFREYCKILNSMDADFQIDVINKPQNEADYMDLWMKEKRDGLDQYRKAYDDVNEQRLSEGRNGSVQERILTVTVRKASFEEARAAFVSLEGVLIRGFKDLGSRLTAMTGNERIRELSDFYHLGDSKYFSFDLASARKLGRDFRNNLCNTSVQYGKNTIEDEAAVRRVLYIKNFPESLSDQFVTNLTSMPIHMIFSLNVIPIPKELTVHTLQKKALGVEADILKQQRVRNRNGDFSTDIAYSKRVEKRQIEKTMDEVRENDQCLFYVGILIVISASDWGDLEHCTQSIQTLGQGFGCRIEVFDLLQRQALNTALPIGVRQVEVMRTLLTQSLAAFLPFNVAELGMDGFCYGTNQISHNLVCLDRRKLMNGNGFIIGVSGSGKSFLTKMEMGAVRLENKEEIYVIDPMNEFEEVAESHGGAFLRISPDANRHLNPMEVDLSNFRKHTLSGTIAEKATLLYGIIEQCQGEELTSRQRSVIDRSVRNIYTRLLETGSKDQLLLQDLYEELKCQPEGEGSDLALSLEVFVHGSLNIFNHPRNVETTRFTVFGIRDLGKELEAVSMLVILETIERKILENEKKGIRTRLYIDEFHVLLGMEYGSQRILRLWKEVRKQGGLCTAITQNITEIFRHPMAEDMLANSEFVALMSQHTQDREQIREKLGISDELLDYCIGSGSGFGILRAGGVTVPIDTRISKENLLYRLYNTDVGGRYEYSAKEW